MYFFHLHTEYRTLNLNHTSKLCWFDLLLRRCKTWDAGLIWTVSYLITCKKKYSQEFLVYKRKRWIEHKIVIICLLSPRFYEWFCKKIYLIEFYGKSLCSKMYCNFFQFETILISKYIFCFREMRKHSFNHLLIILSCFDLAFIVCGVPVHVAPVFAIEGWLYAKLYQYIFYPLTSVSFTGSIYMTLAITIERCVNIVWIYPITDNEKMRLTTIISSII